MLLPTKVDKKPSGLIVDRAGIGQDGYIFNEEYHLELSFFDHEYMEIRYKSENDDEFLSDDEVKFILRNLGEYENSETEELEKGFNPKKKN